MCFNKPERLKYMTVNGGDLSPTNLHQINNIPLGLRKAWTATILYSTWAVRFITNKWVGALNRKAGRHQLLNALAGIENVLNVRKVLNIWAFKKSPKTLMLDSMPRENTWMWMKNLDLLTTKTPSADIVYLINTTGKASMNSQFQKLWVVKREPRTCMTSVTAVEWQALEIKFIRLLNFLQTSSKEVVLLLDQRKYFLVF